MCIRRNTMNQHILTDMMGTTTPETYKQKKLQHFREHGAAHVESAMPKEVQQLRDHLMAKHHLSFVKELSEYVVSQIKTGNKDPDFMKLIGFVDAEGYASGALRSEVFDDVPIAFTQWKQNGKGIYVYSSGNETSQRALFQSTTHGDLSPHIDGYFDTRRIGKKTEADSYKRIADQLKQPTAGILYLSDLVEELDAADHAGMPVVLVNRPGNTPQPKNHYQQIDHFLELNA